MQLPGDAPTEIIDPFIVLNHPDLPQVPMPRESLRDEESLAAWPASDIVGHLFKKDDVVRARYKLSETLDGVVAVMDDHGIGRAGIPLAPGTPVEVFEGIAKLDGRIFVSLRANPHEGMGAVRKIEELCGRYPFIRSVSLTPFQIYPFIPPNSKEYYPIYAKCVELGRAVFINVGFPGPRVPAWVQDPIHLDEVCWFFPELTVVMRHGGLPWTETCAQMLLRWPNLYYATTAVAPRYYPPAIIDLANRRGINKVIFAGYWPLLSYERIFAELSALPINDAAWHGLLSGNAVRAFGLEPAAA
jgi:predicted TIM-barrel fold metal-dependent hydrolase